MPLVMMATNMKASEIPAGFEEKFSECVAKCFGRPEKAVLLEMCTDMRMFRGGMDKHGKGMHLKVCAGKKILDAKHITECGHMMTEMLHNMLKLDMDKIIITYHTMDASNVYAKGDTLDHLLEQHMKH